MRWAFVTVARSRPNFPLRVWLMRIVEKQRVYTFCQDPEFGPADAVVIQALRIKFGADASWVRRQHKNSRTDDDRFLDRVCHEEHREPELVPQ